MTALEPSALRRARIVVLRSGSHGGLRRRAGDGLSVEGVGLVAMLDGVEGVVDGGMGHGIGARLQNGVLSWERGGGGSDPIPIGDRIWSSSRGQTDKDCQRQGDDEFAFCFHVYFPFFVFLARGARRSGRNRDSSAKTRRSATRAESFTATPRGITAPESSLQPAQ